MMVGSLCVQMKKEQLVLRHGICELPYSKQIEVLHYSGFSCFFWKSNRDQAKSKKENMNCRSSEAEAQHGGFQGVPLWHQWNGLHCECGSSSCHVQRLHNTFASGDDALSDADPDFYLPPLVVLRVSRSYTPLHFAKFSWPSNSSNVSLRNGFLRMLNALLPVTRWPEASRPWCKGTAKPGRQMEVKPVVSEDPPLSKVSQTLANIAWWCYHLL